MDAVEFVYWLQGALELGKLETLDKAQLDMVKAHLALVLTNVTDCGVRESAPSLAGDGPAVDVQAEGDEPAKAEELELTKARIRELLERSDARSTQRIHSLLTTPGRFDRGCCLTHRRIC